MLGITLNPASCKAGTTTLAVLISVIGVTQLNTISQAEDHRVPVQNYPQLRKSYQGAEKLSGQVEGIKWSTENGRLLTHIFDIVCVSLPISMDIVGLSVPIPFVFAEEPLFQQPAKGLSSSPTSLRVRRRRREGRRDKSQYRSHGGVLWNSTFSPKGPSPALPEFCPTAPEGAPPAEPAT